MPALALAELYAALAPYEQPVPELFELLVRSLHALEGHPEPLAAAVWAESRLLAEAGFSPELTACVDTGAPPSGPVWPLSPMAGGLVSPETARRYPDAFTASREAVIGWRRTAELVAPPNHLRRAEECVIAMAPFWREICGVPLPAHDAWVAELRLRAGGTESARQV